MLNRRYCVGVLIGVLVTAAARGQTVNLTEAPLAQRCVRNELTMELEGKILVRQSDKENAYPHQAQAKHVFLERYLEVNGLIATKAARHYLTAEASTTFNNDEKTRRTLRPERKFLVAQRTKDQLFTFSPHGQLTRTEMEVTEHLDTMAVAGLVPGKNVEVGKSWSISSTVVAALCDLDGLTEQNLEATLEKVDGNLAHIKIVGKAHGINLGAQVGMLINARCEFDVKQRCVVFLEWKESDDRRQGPVSPALNAEVTIKLKRTPIDEPEQLNKFALVPIPDAAMPPEKLTNLYHQDAKKRYTFSHARNWHVVSPDDNGQLVMRLVERGEFIAQATITPWKKVDPTKAMSIGDFAELMAKTPGWALDKETDRKTLENPPKGHHTVHRVIASGELDGVRTVQYFYLIVGTSGEQLIVTYSVVPQQVQRLGSRDLEMVREIAFPD
jgi:hypothetical protein